MVDDEELNPPLPAARATRRVAAVVLQDCKAVCLSPGLAVVDQLLPVTQVVSIAVHLFLVPEPWLHRPSLIAPATARPANPFSLTITNHWPAAADTGGVTLVRYHTQASVFVW
jgi:hypothetical protein